MAKEKGSGLFVVDETRRSFLKQAMIAPVAGLTTLKSLATVPVQGSERDVPWYRKTYRWGQTNINEKDPIRYDVGWWREHWKQTRVQGLVINAGGIVAYYPSKLKLQHRAQYLGDRDLYGELVRAAHEDGLVVLARMDSNRVHEDFYRAHSEWMAVNRDGKPYRAAELYVTCINSPYYDEFIPGILREIVAHAKPEGFTDNSWSGLDRDSICCCQYCTRKFRELYGKDLPPEKDWNNSVYRQWIDWNYQRRLEIWDLYNRTTKAAGGPHCLWIGMVGGDVISSGRRFRDLKAICERAELIMFDDQGRSNLEGFNGNAEKGKRMHGILGWEKLIPESMAMYQRIPTFRKTAAPAPEARMWMLEGFAGTIQPWWHHVGAYQEDRRQFRTAESVYRWYEANQSYLVNRRPVATVGVVWSQQNTDFYGRDDAGELVEVAYRGLIHALTRARIPYLPVHVGHIDRDGPGLSVLILPNIAAMTEAQIDSVRRFVERGGSLVATGETSLYNRWGEALQDFALADLFKAHANGKRYGSMGPAQTGSEDHTYLRLSPDVGKDVYGPKVGDEPGVSVARQARHPVLRGFEATNILPFGGSLLGVQAEAKAIVPLTFIPHFPVYPPETSWMSEPRTDIAALVLSTVESGARIAYLPADIDRRYGHDNLPDHGDLLANIIRWAADDKIPLSVDGPGLIDCNLYEQPGRLILHLVNLTSVGAWRAPVEELIPVGPHQVKVKLPVEMSPKNVRLLVSNEKKSLGLTDGWAVFEVRSIADHEVAVIE